MCCLRRGILRIHADVAQMGKSASPARHQGAVGSRWVVTGGGKAAGGASWGCQH